MSIKKIVVVGGGTAGWMAAAALSKLKTGRQLDITLVESEQIGTVGVGEATIPPFVIFNKLLEIDERQLLSEVQATFKLGIQFTNWGNIGESYFHPFGSYGYEVGGVPFHSIWLKYRMDGDTRPLHAFSPETIAAQHRKFARTETVQRDDLPPINYAYHLDASQYARFLRRYSEERGVVRQEGKVSEVKVHPETGFVKSVSLENGETVDGDLFIDCTGFRGLLIEQALETGYEDWTHWLPCDRAAAIPSTNDGPNLPYTRSTAWSAGWQFQVPLQKRDGNGHVYCSEYMSDDEAIGILKDNIGGEPLADPNLIRFKTGHRKKFWNKNVVALGLAAGFMEPLESTSIHLINTGITKLMALLSLDGISLAQETAYNRFTTKEYQRIRDFIILHYKATERNDSPFWDYCRTMSIPASLEEKIELFKINGQVFREEDELFTDTSWVAVMMGQGIIPNNFSPLTTSLKEPSLSKEIAEVEKSIRFLVEQMPTHRDFIQQYCPATP